MFNKSLSKRIFITVLFALTIILLISRLGIYYFADDFYYKSKEQKMKETSKQVVEFIAKTANKNNSIARYINKQANILGGTIVVTDKNNNILYSNLRFQASLSGGTRASIMLKRLNTTLAKSLYYTKSSDDSEWIEYKHETDELIVSSRISVPSIDDSLKSIGTMFNYITLIAFFIAIAASYFAARNISRPLLELNSVATDLSELNFSSRFKIKRKDEIGQLGNTFNNMAQRLQTTISRLKQELRKEKDSEKVRRAFVARASHELRTPLAVISGYTEALQDNVADGEEDKQRYYDIIKNESVKLNSLVQDMLELTRLENPEFSINKEDFDLINLVINLVEKQLKFNSNDIQIKVSNLPSSFIVNGDQRRIEQAVSNIFRNALRHTSNNGFININAEQNGNDITINIENSGSHIDEDSLPHIWDSFYTTDKGEGTSDGTGLGLSIVKNILLKHNCLFGAENTSTGVKFWFTITKES